VVQGVRCEARGGVRAQVSLVLCFVGAPGAGSSGRLSGLARTDLLEVACPRKSGRRTARALSLRMIGLRGRWMFWVVRIWMRCGLFRASGLGRLGGGGLAKGGGRSVGPCYKCGEYGHLARECGRV